MTIAQVGTRFGQAFAVSTNGSVYAWGMPSGDMREATVLQASVPLRCSMGFGEIASMMRPTPLPCFGSRGCSTHCPIRCVVVGASHTIFVSESGAVFTVGRNDSGQLGFRSDSEDVLVPQRVCFPTEPAPSIVGAAAGAQHSLFLTSTGEVWGCGFSASGALPVTGSQKTVDLTLLELLPCFCTSVAAGAKCSFFVSDRGEVYFAGQAIQSERPFNRPRSLESSIPWKIENLGRVSQVSVSMELPSFRWEHALFAHEDGSISGWGQQAHGELGFVKQSGCVPGFTNTVVKCSI